MQDFGTVVKILKMTNAVDHQRAVRTPDMIETVRELISTDRRMTLRMMEEEALSRLVQRIHRVRPQFQERGSWFLLHDNARQYQ
jgi:C4-type Zn-finger protein